MNLTSNNWVFFELVKSGLWGTEVRLSSYGVIDYSSIYTLAEEQSVVGLITAGLEQVKDVKVPQEVLLQFIGSCLQIEQRNKLLNGLVAQLIEKLRGEDVYTLLVKGQGIAQCYDKPLWRASGDVDLFLSDNNYRKAFQILSNIASSVDEENKRAQHIAMTIDGWAVELHGTLRSGLWRKLDKEIDKVQRDVFYGGKVRSWMNGRTQVFLPAADEDVVFVFSHILQHFFKEGIGLRQICDWCRLLWTYKDSLNQELLGQRIRKARAMSEWKAFGALAVEYLGMPVEAMPFYSDSPKWSRKAERVMGFVLETGNFGHNRDYSYYKKYPYLVFKLISLWRHIMDTFRYFRLFPLDSLKVLWLKMQVGLMVSIQGKRHE